MTPLSFIWNLYLTDSQNFPCQVFQERVETLQKQLHTAEKKLMSREFENQEQVTAHTPERTPWPLKDKTDASSLSSH